jgi:hypothetical protein
MPAREWIEFVANDRKYLPILVRDLDAADGLA